MSAPYNNRYSIKWNHADMPWPTDTIVDAESPQEALYLLTDKLNASVGVGAFEIVSIVIVDDRGSVRSWIDGLKK